MHSTVVCMPGTLNVDGNNYTLLQWVWGEMFRASACMEDANATVFEAKSVCPLSLAYWYILHLDSKSLQWEMRAL